MDKEQLIELFTLDSDAYISGEKLSASLGVSRTAVWKHIQGLKEEGFVFASSPRKGYKLLSQPDRLDKERLTAALQTRELGHTLQVLAEATSTQDIARHWVESGAPHGALVLAEKQTAGRGRFGRVWHSPPGKGIYMSLVLRPEIPLQQTPRMPLLAAVALCRTLRRLTGVDASIKWPNDILIRGRKVSGILMDSSAEDERLSYIIAGFGISANLEEGDYPEELLGVATSLLMESGKLAHREELITEFLKELEEWLDVYKQEGFSPILSLWEALSSTLGHEVNVHTPSGSLQGYALGLHESGALILRLKDGQERYVFSGSVYDEGID